MKVSKTKIQLKSFSIGNELPFTLIGGLNVLEDRDIAFKTVDEFIKVTEKLRISYIFKASYDKANRSSIDSYRGPGIDKGLEILHEIKEKYNIPVLTDVHTCEEALKAAEICDVIQLPAFLARQTDLIKTMASTKSIINIKKPQFVSPSQIKNILKKFTDSGNNELLVCERGTNFGYDNLIVDMLGFGVVKKTCGNIPLIFDVTHSLQFRKSGEETSNGRRSQILELAKAGLANKIAGIFLEAHPNPNEALCDGPSALPLMLLEPFLKQLKEVDSLIKSQTELRIE